MAKLDLLIIKKMAIFKKFFWGPPQKFSLKESNPQKSFNKILIVTTAGLGDTIFSLPLLKILKDEMPQSFITFVIKKDFLDLFTRYIPPDLVNEIKAYRRGFFSLIKFYYFFRKRQFDVGLFFLDDAARLRLLAYLAGIKYLFSRSSEGLSWCRSNDDDPLEIDTVAQRLFLIQKLLDKKIERKNVYLNLPEEKTSQISKRLREKVNSKILIGFNPGAANFYKCWPKENFLALGKEILSSIPNSGIVIFGDQKEKDICNYITKNLSSKKVLNLCGKIPLTDLPLYIKAVNLLVTNDTGPLHLAVAIKTPTVSLFVPTNAKGTGPMQDKDIHYIIQKERPCKENCKGKKCPYPKSCMHLISVEEVLSVTKKLIFDKKDR